MGFHFPPPTIAGEPSLLFHACCFRGRNETDFAREWLLRFRADGAGSSNRKELELKRRRGVPFLPTCLGFGGNPALVCLVRACSAFGLGIVPPWEAEYP